DHLAAAGPSDALWRLFTLPLGPFEEVSANVLAVQLVFDPVGQAGFDVDVVDSPGAKRPVVFVLLLRFVDAHHIPQGAAVVVARIRGPYVVCNGEVARAAQLRE